MGFDHIGVRVRHWRLKRGLSQRALAGLAGFSQSYVVQVENGTAALDKRSAQNKFARALQVSPADLTGQPYDPQTVEHSAATAAVPALRTALAAVSLDDRGHEGTRSAGELRDAVRHAVDLHNACQYDQLAPLLPGLLLDLHARADSADVRRMLVWTSYASAFTGKYLGYEDLALLAAQCTRTVAAAAGEPAYAALAEFALLHNMPQDARDLAVRRADRVIGDLEPLIGDPNVAQVYGMLHLSAAMFAGIAGNNDSANTHLDEADRVAATTGEGNFAQLWFGPTNAQIWRVGVYVELGEGGRVLTLPTTNPSLLGSRNRQATYHADLGRALAQTRQHDARALAELLRAETLAPQRVRLSPATRETAGAMLRRVRAGNRRHLTDLQALAERLNMV